MKLFYNLASVIIIVICVFLSTLQFTEGTVATNILGVEVVQNSPCVLGSITEPIPCRRCMCVPFRMMVCSNRICLPTAPPPTTTRRPEPTRPMVYPSVTTDFPLFTAPSTAIMNSRRRPRPRPRPKFPRQNELEEE